MNEHLHELLEAVKNVSVSVEQDQGEALPHLLVVQRDIHVFFLSPYVTKPGGAFLLFQRLIMADFLPSRVFRRVLDGLCRPT